jgi:uncharacterized protein YcbX
MTDLETVGVVAELWRFPVKSMGGERLDDTVVSGQSLLGDRAYALLDPETGDLVSASNKHYPGLMDWRATFVEPPRVDRPLPPVELTAPDGSSAPSDSPALAALLSARFGRPVTLVHAAPAAYRAKQAAFFADVGLGCLAPEEALVDLCPVSVISLATLAGVSRARPGSRIDSRRFRMNLVLATTSGGLGEHAWIGGRLTLGGSVELSVALPDPRCVMVTLPQGDLPRDPGILRTIAELSTLPVGSGKNLPCAGVYATVARSGRVLTGDPVSFTRA